MIILDTDCISLIERGSPESKILLDHLESADTDEIATTIVNFEEQMRGWLAFVAKAKTIDQQVLAYQRLNRFLDNYRSINMLPFEEVAAIEPQVAGEETSDRDHGSKDRRDRSCP
jgi:tRNA(fMet)-specific endonuclease VapC